MRPSELNHIIPPDTFLSTYLKFNSEIETPHSYDLWGGLWLLSFAVGRHCFVARPRAPVFFNMYVMLIAESGMTRKSSAIANVTKIAKSLDIAYEYKWIEGGSPLRTLEQHLLLHSLDFNSTHLVFSVSELMRALGKGTGATGIPALLIDLYDCPEEQRLLEGTLQKVYSTFIGATTPTALMTSINPELIEVGFTSRMYPIVGQNRKKIVAWPEIELNEHFWLLDLTQRLNQFTATAKEVQTLSLSAEGKKLLIDWYKHRATHQDSYRASFEAREDHHVLKIAGLLSINDHRWEIDAPDIENAWHIIKEVKDFGSTLFVSDYVNEKLAKSLKYLINYILKRPAPTRTHTLKNIASGVKMSGQHFDLLIAIMHELGYIQLWTATTAPGARGKGAQFVSATDKLREEADAEKVSELVINHLSE